MPVILLVDNEEALVELYRHTFENAGHSFVATNNVNEALKICRGGGINLVLLDLLLPIDQKTNESVGFVLLKSLKTLPTTKDMPVVMLTNLNLKNYQEKAKKLGATEFLVKSDNVPKQVLAKVEEILKK